MSGVQWYIPSWNGDIRFEAEGSDKTLVKVISPTAAEMHRLRVLTVTFKKTKWIEQDLWRDSGDPGTQITLVHAPIEEVARYLIAGYTPGRATLTVVKFSDNHVVAVEAGKGFLGKMKELLWGPSERARQAIDVGEPGDPYRVIEPEILPAPKPVPKPKPQPRVITVSRPSICCPRCIEGPLTPAGEVLFAFLTEEEKQEYIANDHSLVVYGGITGRPYLVSHRHGKWARKYGKICRDLEGHRTLHFHDTSLPPEEELLTAKLLLEHCEHWVATWGSGAPVSLPNPFGDGMDGTRSTDFTYQIGRAVTQLEEFFAGPNPRNLQGGCPPYPGA